MKKTIILDSRNRLRGTSTNFDINVNPPIPFTSIKLKSFHIPVSWYNITTSNNTFTVEQTSIEYNVVVAVGRYTMTQLLSSLKSGLDTATSSTFTCTRDDKTGLITITNTVPTNFIIKSTGLLEEYLGFTTEQTGAATYTSSKVSKMYDPDYIVMSLSNVHNNVRHLDNNSEHGTFVISIDNLDSDTEIGTIKYNNKDDDIDQVQLSTQQLFSNVSVYLFDKDHKELELNGSEWVGIIEIK